MTVKYFTAIFLAIITETKKSPLEDSKEFWAVIFKYALSPANTSKGSEMLNELCAKLSQDHKTSLSKLFQTAGPFINSFSELNDLLNVLNSKATAEIPEIRKKSFFGILVRSVYIDYVKMSLESQIEVNEKLKRDFLPVSRRFGLEIEDPGVAKLKQLLQPSGVFLPDLNAQLNGLNLVYNKSHLSTDSGFNTPNFSIEVANDLEAMQYLSHRNCDLGLTKMGKSKLGDGLGLADLSYSYNFQGYMAACLKAVYESFVCDRLSIAREMRSEEDSSDVKEGVDEADDAKYKADQDRSRQWNRDLVGWLAALMYYHGRTSKDASEYIHGEDAFKGIEPALDYPLKQLNEYRNRTARTPAEKMESSLEMIEARLDGSGPNLTFDDLTKLEAQLYDANFINEEGHALSFLRAITELCMYLGLNNLAKSYSRKTLELCDLEGKTLKNASINDISMLRIVCGQLLANGLYMDDLPNSINRILEFKKQGLWENNCQMTYVLLLGIALIKCHALRAAKQVLSQLNHFELPIAHLDGKKYAEYLLLLYSCEFQSAYAYAQRTANEYMNAKSTKMELFFLTKAARALVLQRSPLFEKQAHMLITKTLSRVVKHNMNSLKFELVLLQARLLDTQSSKTLCSAVEDILPSASTPSLKIEFMLLNEGKVSTTQLANALYTEFDDKLIATQFDQPDILKITPQSRTCAQDSKNALAALFLSSPISADDVEDAYIQVAGGTPFILKTPQQRITSTPIARNNDVSPLGAPLGFSDGSPLHLQHKRIREATPGQNTKRRPL